ncbi:hypothetical protein WJX72_008511 [[Myrmecia] bisecta]|uniref:Uncharacterized protein n=1 Tax=[Myrmecia] bisecta TaxID=41462 RepID=A0AAW1Q9N2_9CHLO
MKSAQLSGRSQLASSSRQTRPVQQPAGRLPVTCLRRDLIPSQLPAEVTGSSLRRLPELQSQAYTRQSIATSGLTSKLDFLLAPRTLSNLAQDARSSAPCRKINHDIKMAADWHAIRAIIEAHSDAQLDETNVAFALFRLGALFSFLPPQQQAELKACGLVEDLAGLAFAKLSSMRPTELWRTMDAFAHLHHHPGSRVLEALLLHAEPLLPRFDATQLPLFLWAFAVLSHRPSVETMCLIDDQVLAKSERFTPQGVSLALWSYQTLKHTPDSECLRVLSTALLKRMQFFKSAEIANCLSAFAAMGFHPGNELLQAVAKRAGRTLDAAPRRAPAGKRSLVPDSVKVSSAAPKVAALKRSMSDKLNDLKAASSKARDTAREKLAGASPSPVRPRAV